jgi:hypothetical protein
MALTKADKLVLEQLRQRLTEGPERPPWTTRTVVLGEPPELAVVPERLLVVDDSRWVLVSSFASWEAQGARRYAATILSNTASSVVVTLLGNERTYPAALRRAVEYVALAGTHTARRNALRILRRESP